MLRGGLNSDSIAYNRKRKRLRQQSAEYIPNIILTERSPHGESFFRFQPINTTITDTIITLYRYIRVQVKILISLSAEFKADTKI